MRSVSPLSCSWRPPLAGSQEQRFGGGPADEHACGDRAPAVSKGDTDEPPTVRPGDLPGHALQLARQGLCAQSDPEAFFPGKGESPAPAKAICARCPVTARCLEHALANDERLGVWVGTSERERRRLRRYREAKAS
ncbi:WhiB family transcriptional regulator [Georgenia halophila]|uniref:WhiB family transcriptional regulator n=1 Tax=Georgenia halophila TaxID=620889 RepID=UPI0031ED9277